MNNQERKIKELCRVAARHEFKTKAAILKVVAMMIYWKRRADMEKINQPINRKYRRIKDMYGVD